MGRTKLTVYIGRFSPFHKGHAYVLKKAMETSDYVLVIIGSTGQARSPKNPWTFDERRTMIVSWALDNLSKSRVIIRGVRDSPYNEELWITHVNEQIHGVISEFELKDVDVSVIGSDRDASTFYLRCFPQFELQLVTEDHEVSRFLTATSVRDLFFRHVYNGNLVDTTHYETLLRAFLPVSTVGYLQQFESTRFFKELQEEHLFNIAYRQPYLELPYEVIFNTVDSLVISAGHILLVRRRSRPGKGLLALPGGFLNARERIVDAAIRELREETKLKVPEAVLRGSLVNKDVFDYPDRSLRGRIITTVFVFKLRNTSLPGEKVELPSVRGGSDASKAMWVSIDGVLRASDQFFEDHFHIIETSLGRL